jgi:transcriptional regulator with XRE-family HTH domain
MDQTELAAAMGAAFMREMRRRGLSIVDVSELAGVDKQTVGNFVGGRRARVPSNRILKQLQIALNLPEDFFIDIETPVSPLVQDSFHRTPPTKDLTVDERETIAKAAVLLSQAAALLATIAQPSSPPPPPLGEGSTS